jgi:hypothetical protein
MKDEFKALNDLVNNLIKIDESIFLNGKPDNTYSTYMKDTLLYLINSEQMQHENIYDNLSVFFSKYLSAEEVNYAELAGDIALYLDDKGELTW